MFSSFESFCIWVMAVFLFYCMAPWFYFQHFCIFFATDHEYFLQHPTKISPFFPILRDSEHVLYSAHTSWQYNTYQLVSTRPPCSGCSPINIKININISYYNLDIYYHIISYDHHHRHHHHCPFAQIHLFLSYILMIWQNQDKLTLGK